MRNTFKVYERLKREQHINTLFLTGKAFSVFPVRVIYRIIEEAEKANPSPPLEPAPRSPLSPLKVGFSVPKKKFRSSVHRHRIRRLMFEAWRLHKVTLTDAIPQGKSIHVFLVFTGKEMPEYEVVKTAVITAIEKLKTIISTPA